MRHVLAIAALALGASTAANAVTIVNGSFENLTVTVPPSPRNSSFYEVLAPNTTAIVGWSVTPVGKLGLAGVDIIYKYWQQDDGNYSLDLSARDAGSISQQLTGLRGGGHYTLTFDLAGNPAGLSPKSVLVSVGSITPETFTINSGVGYSSRNVMNWATQSYSFVANSTTALLTFRSLNAGNAGAALDNVAITGGLVPEPSSWMMMIVGFGLIGFAARRKKLAIG